MNVDFPTAASDFRVRSPQRVRVPAVAGTFYPSEPARLRQEVESLIHHASGVGPIPQALIVPHAGYRYSGPVAASGDALLVGRRQSVQRVVLIGPSHRMAFSGLGASSADAFLTPLGAVRLDTATIERCLMLPQVQVRDDAHQFEHSLEVQLPFLQTVFDEFRLIPFVVGEATATEIAELLDLVWTDDQTLIVVSSDLSHFHDYEAAKLIDGETSRMIENRQTNEINNQRACGCRGIRGLLAFAEAHHLRVKAVDVRNSGDMSGMKDQVVGYGGFVVY